jgi:hypothetical protein
LNTEMVRGAGLCGASLRAFKFKNDLLHTFVLEMLIRFLDNLSEESQETASAVLVAGNIVELTLEHMVKTGGDVSSSVVLLLSRFWLISDGQQRMCTQGLTEQLLQWIAERLQMVGNVVMG